MNASNARTAAIIMALVLVAHAVLAFTKARWYTGLVEVVGAVVLAWNWNVGRPRAAP
jgi:hypothetical protein